MANYQWYKPILGSIDYLWQIPAHIDETEDIANEVEIARGLQLTLLDNLDTKANLSGDTFTGTLIISTGDLTVSTGDLTVSTGNILIGANSVAVKDAALSNGIIVSADSLGRLTTSSGIQTSDIAKLSGVQTLTGTYTFNGIPNFNGGTSGSLPPFYVDSTFLVTNLNANLLDGINNLQFLRSDINDTFTGDTLTLDSGANLQLENITDVTLSSTLHAFQIGTSSGNNIAMDGNEIMARNNGAASPLHLNALGGDVNINGNKTWHAGNDGTGSGLDADTVDGTHLNRLSVGNGTIATGNADDYKDSGGYRMDPTVTNLPTAHHYAVQVFGNAGNITTQIATKIASTDAYIRTFNTTWTSWQKLWNAGNDGPASGLNADLLDGQHGSYYYSSANPVSRSGLDTATGSASGTVGQGNSVVLTLGAYSFSPSLGGTQSIRVSGGGGTSADSPKFRFWNGGKGTESYSAYWRYIVA